MIIIRFIIINRLLPKALSKTAENRLNQAPLQKTDMFTMINGIRHLGPSMAYKHDTIENNNYLGYMCKLVLVANNSSFIKDQLR